MSPEFDGATMPAGVCTARELLAPFVTLGADGYAKAELAAIAPGN